VQARFVLVAVAKHLQADPLPIALRETISTDLSEINHEAPARVVNPEAVTPSNAGIIMSR
jgi:hypothetical protein